MTSWGGMSSATMRSDTRFMVAKKVGRKMSPGPLEPAKRPRKNDTPRSYCLSTRRLENE